MNPIRRYRYDYTLPEHPIESLFTIRLLESYKVYTPPDIDNILLKKTLQEWFYETNAEEHSSQKNPLKNMKEPQHPCVIHVPFNSKRISHKQIINDLKAKFPAKEGWFFTETIIEDKWHSDKDNLKHGIKLAFLSKKVLKTMFKYRQDKNIMITFNDPNNPKTRVFFPDYVFDFNFNIQDFQFVKE